MINDKTIDSRNATFWCAFNDKKLLSKLDEAASSSDGKQLAKIIKAVQRKTKQKTESQLREGMWDFAQAAHQAAFPLATGNPFQPNFRGMDPSSGVPSLQDQQKNNVVAAAVAAAAAGTTFIPGGWAALGAAISGALGTAGSWLASLAPSLVSVGTASVLAIVTGLVSVSTYLYPRIAKLLEDVCRSGEIAKCKFEADGEKYLAVFSLKRQRWQLVFQGSRFVSSTVDVPPVDIQSFFESEFFNKFLAQCKKYVDAVYKDTKRMKCLEVLGDMADKESKKDMQQLLDAKTPIEQYMLKGMYTTS